MWKIAVIALVVIFLIVDSIYLYFRLKNYWRQSRWSRPGSDSRKWKIGLSSLDLPATRQDKDGQPPDNSP